MTKNELTELIHNKYSLLEDGEGSAAGSADLGSSFSFDTSGIDSASSSVKSSDINSSSSSSSSTSSNEYNNSDVLFGDNGSSSPDTGSYGNVSGGSGEVAPQSNPFQDEGDEEGGNTQVQEPDKYEVLEILEKNPNYPDERDYIKVRNIKTNEIKVIPLSQIDLA